MRAHDVLVDACGALDCCEGATEPDWKKESLCSASWVMRAEMLRPVLAAGVAALPVLAPRTSSETIPKPATATPADATFKRRARRRAGARREEGAADTFS
jgi:hypothetical protein